MIGMGNRTLTLTLGAVLGASPGGFEHEQAKAAMTGRTNSVLMFTRALILNIRRSRGDGRGLRVERPKAKCRSMCGLRKRSCIVSKGRSEEHTSELQSPC